MRSGDPVDGVQMGAQLLVGVVMAAFADEVQVEVGEQVRESVRIENFERVALLGAVLDFVTGGLRCRGLLRGPRSLEQSFLAHFHCAGNLRR